LSKIAERVFGGWGLRTETRPEIGQGVKKQEVKHEKKIYLDSPGLSWTLLDFWGFSPGRKHDATTTHLDVTWTEELE
jgi:hypothetical protein